MAVLNDTERRKIVQRLATFESPVEVAEWASEEFEKDIEANQVVHYDPTRSDDIANKWQTVFKETREQFLNDFDAIPLSHQAVRLRELQRLYKYVTRALTRDGDGGEVSDLQEAARLLKQAAKEVGGKFTNVERKEHSGPEGNPIEVRDVQMTDAELAEIASEAETHTNGTAQ